MNPSSQNRRTIHVETLEERRMLSAAPFGNTLIIDRNVPGPIRLDQAIVVEAKLPAAVRLQPAGRAASGLSRQGRGPATRSESRTSMGKPPAPVTVGKMQAGAAPSASSTNRSQSEMIGAGQDYKRQGKPGHHHKPKPAHHAKQPKPHHVHVVQNPVIYYPAPVANPVENQDPTQSDSTQNDPTHTDPTQTDPTQTSAPAPVSAPAGPSNEPNASGVANWVDESGNPLFGPNGPSPDDIYQGSAADCYFLATLSSVARTDPGLIEQDVTDLGGGNYQVQFYSNGTPVDQVVDGYLPVDSNGNLMYAQLGQGNDIWVAIMEKAFANYRSSVFGASPDYANINYGVGEEVFAALGGSNIVGLGQADLPDGPTLFNMVASDIAAGQAVTYETPNDPNAGPLVSNHLYSVVGAYQNADGSYGLELRNPYGNDGPNGDGYNWVDANTAQGQLFDLAAANV